jgi:hypothetical protein
MPLDHKISEFRNFASSAYRGSNIWKKAEKIAEE